MGSTTAELNLNHFQTSASSTPPSNLDRLAVSVQNACKKYLSKKESAQILNNFCMSVTKGHIYSLLGSSGCGKTTLLSCVVGLRRVDSGKVLAFGYEPGQKGSGIPGRRVGYMPQEIALNREFSIGEVLHYFGRLYGMRHWEVEDNTKFLVSFLKLPPVFRRIHSLSGGQQRRVSFAVALIHNPELLILDEPTVGVDPLLRQSIWSHLVKLASTTNTTVIITTHFIEEARDSNCIGLMRNGKLLVEDSPGNLMNRYNTYILEDIVVQLCLRDNTDEQNAKEPPPSSEPSLRSIALASLRSGTSPPSGLSQLEEQGPDLNSILETNAGLQVKRKLSLGQVLHRASDPAVIGQHDLKTQLREKCDRIYALLNKNVLVLVRNLVFVLFIIGLPAIQIVLVCLAIGIDPHDIKIAVVNNEVDGDTCAKMPPKLGCVMGSATSYQGYASCQFMNELDHDIFTLIPYNNTELALEDVRLTKLWGVMSFSYNFTAYLKDRLIFGVYTETESLIGSQITFDLDMSNMQVGVQIKKNLYETLKDFMFRLAGDCKVDTSGLDTPLNFPAPVYGRSDTSFTEFLAPGILLAILFFFPLCATSVSMIAEKKSGALERTKVAGVTELELMISHFFTNFALLICQTMLSYLIMISVFKIEVKGSIMLAHTLGVLIGVAGISFGFLMAVICRDELEAVMVSFGTFMPNFILSGVLWPLEGMPVYLRAIAYGLPCTLAGESLRSIIGRGQVFTHPSIWPGFLTSSIYVVLYWIITLSIHHVRNKK